MNIIDFPIKPKKQTQWHWRIHPYFTKQASNVVREYVKNFSNELDLNKCEREFIKIEKEILPLVKFVRESKQKDVDLYKIKDWYPKGIKLPSNSDFEFVEDLPLIPRGVLG